MKKMRNVLALVLCAMLLVAGSVMGTLAYLKSTSSVNNTFTIGKVEITMDEALVTEYGEVATADWADANDDDVVDYDELSNIKKAEDDDDTYRVIENTYKLIPSHTYVKDPTIRVSADSEDCYLFVEITNGLDGVATINGLNANGWEPVQGEDNVWAYTKTETDDVVSGGAEVKVFDTFTFSESADPDTYKDESIAVTAYAIQADGLGSMTPAARWALANP